MRCAVIASLALTVTPAAADPDLKLSHEPPPRHLRMRRAAQTTPPSLARARPAPPPITTPPAALPITGSDDLGVRDVKQPVSFSLNVGYQVEATRLSGKPTLGGAVLDPNSENYFQRLRSYGFGEGFLSTRGIGIPSLSTYFSLRFQVAKPLGNVIDLATQAATDRAKPPPIATWFERSGTELRTGWAEVKDFLPQRLGLSELRIRVGDMFIYGPWVIHTDGGLIAWETKLLKLQGYVGARHPDYNRDVVDDRAPVLGSSARIDLRGLRTPLPIAIAGEVLLVGPNQTSGTPASNNQQLEIDWRPRQDFALIGKLRRLDGKTANERLEFRGRYKQVSNLVFDLIHREEADWRWDPAFGRVDDDRLTARTYLDLGPVLPQLVASARGGTLIAENLDLFVRGSIASDLTSKDKPTTSYNASYVEAGGALQVRLRRTVALDASILSRQTSLATPTQIVDVRPTMPLATPQDCATSAPVACQGLPDAATQGEQGFTEIGAALRMSLGARRFSAVVEIYGRKTRYAQLYSDAKPEDASDIRGGGRFTIDAWVGQSLRLYAAYDLSSRFEFAPEITGYKSLRLIIAGTY